MAPTKLRAKKISLAAKATPDKLVLKVKGKRGRTLVVADKNTKKSLENADFFPPSRNGEFIDKDSDTNIVCSDLFDCEREAKKTDYHERLFATREKWNELLPKQVEVFCERLVQSTEEELLCSDCGLESKLCVTSCQNWHVYAHTLKETKSYPLFHRDNASERIYLQLPVSHSAECCGIHSTVYIRVFDEKARFRPCTAEVCSLDGDLAVSLIRHNLWACSPEEPKTAVHISTMRLLYAFSCYARTPLSRCCSALQAYGRMFSEQDKTPDLYPLVNRHGSFRFFRRFFQALWYLRDAPFLSDKMDLLNLSCAACPKIGGEMVISADACFQISQKYRAATMDDFPDNTKYSFLCDQEKVNRVVSAESSEERISEVASDQSSAACSSFVAGDSLVATVKNKSLLIKGKFGTCCSHDFPLKFADMYFGERFSYPKEVLRQVMQTLHPETKVTVMYDVGCKFEAHLKKKREIDLLKNDYVVPAFHIWAHSLSCQLWYGPRILGVGLIDGEGMERIWSFAQSQNRSFKESETANRAALFDDMLFERGIALNSRIDVRLLRNLKNAEAVHKDAEKQLSEHLERLGLTSEQLVSEFNKIKLEIKQSASKKACDPWESNYVASVEALDSVSEKLKSTSDVTSGIACNLREEKERLENQLSALEAKKGIKTRSQQYDWWFEGLQNRVRLQQLKPILTALFTAVTERLYYGEIIQKYGAGQKLFSKLNRLVKSRSATLNSNLKKFNEAKKPTGIGIPETLSAEDVKNPESEVWVKLQAACEGLKLDVDPALPLKISAIRAMGSVISAQKEKKLVFDSMRSVKLYYQQKVNVLNDLVKENSDLKHSTAGEHGLLLFHQLELQRQLEHFVKVFEFAKEKKDIATECDLISYDDLYERVIDVDENENDYIEDEDDYEFEL